MSFNMSWVLNHPVTLILFWLISATLCLSMWLFATVDNWGMFTLVGALLLLWFLVTCPYKKEN